MTLRVRQRPWCEGLTHEQKLEEAKNRYGRQFKCFEHIGTLEDERRKILDAGREIPKWLERNNKQRGCHDSVESEGSGELIGYISAANVLPCRRRKGTALPLRRRG